MAEAQSIEQMIDRVHRMKVQLMAERARRFNLAWPVGHSERDAHLKQLAVENPTLYECVHVIEQCYGPGVKGCDVAREHNQTSFAA